jgi:Cu-Zn family superoxide dismutase
MKRHFAVLVALLLAATFAWAKEKPKTVELKNAKGESVGTATISPKGHGVAIKLKLMNLAPGEHALHVHVNAKCEAPDFKSAGGHFNPNGKKHGLMNPEGSHNGDMMNITADAKGSCKATVKNDQVTLDEGAANSLFLNGGTAIVIHAKADDMKTDPAGNAGDRIACGVITK